MNKCLAVHGNGVFGGEMFARLEVVDPRTRSKVALIVHIVAATIPRLDAHKWAFRVSLNGSPKSHEWSIEIYADIWLVLLVENRHAVQLTVFEHISVGAKCIGRDGKRFAAIGLKQMRACFGTTFFAGAAVVEFALIVEIEVTVGALIVGIEFGQYKCRVSTYLEVHKR